MLPVEQCRAFAAECKVLAADPRNSARRSTVLTNISRSWIALAHQLESLADIDHGLKQLYAQPSQYGSTGGPQRD
jgi:hypothetical protein